MSGANFGVVAKQDWLEGQRIYWREILYRAHFAAATSLIRTSRWIDAMLTLAEDANYTAFMAAYRGCLESSADSFHTFKPIPTWLAEFHTVIRGALDRKIGQPTLFKDLEDALIHFTHAGYVAKGEHVDPTLRAKANADYLKSLAEAGTPEVTECYRTLCDVTHPGIGSVHCYADMCATKSGTIYHLRMDADETQINQFCKESEKVSERMIYFGVVPPIMMLRILNEFGVKEVYTPGVMKVGVENHPVWKPFADRLKDPSPPAGIPVDPKKLK